MAEDDGLINLEDDTPAPVADTPPAEPAAPVAVAPTEPARAEVDAVEVGGAKYVPVSVLQAVREEAKLGKAAIERNQQLEAELNQARPYVDMLRNNPGLFQQQQRQQEPAQPQQPVADPDAVEVARIMDFYTPNGEPDVAKGRSYLALQDRRAAARTAEAIAPIQQARYQEASTQNFARALALKDADGHSPSVDALRAVWSQMSAEQTADPRVVSVLALTAMGMDRMGKKSPPAPPESVPLVTEASGGGRLRQVLTGLERNVAAARGTDAARWNKLTEGHQAGRSNVLED